jgi:hypothetical protein
MARIEKLEKEIEQYHLYLGQQRQALRAEKERQRQLEEQLVTQRTLLASLEAKQGDKPVKPYSRLAKARKRKKTWQRRLGRSLQREDVARRKISRYQEKIEHLVQKRGGLIRWYATLQVDNATNPNPVRVRIHLDGGFSGGDNLTYLIEMGYDVLAVGSGQSAAALLREQPAAAIWTSVTPHVQVWEGRLAPVGECPYPLRRILQHWQAGEQSRYSILLQYQNGPAVPLTEVFSTYYLRQHVEVGVKQGKSTFGEKDVRIRSAAGLELLNQFAFVFWPNFVHWATDWIRPRVQQGSPPFNAALRTVKTQVRVAAQTPATVITTPGSKVLVFAKEGPDPGVHLQLTGIYAFQLPLPLFRCEVPTRFALPTPRRLLSPPDD